MSRNKSQDRRRKARILGGGSRAVYDSDNFATVKGTPIVPDTAETSYQGPKQASTAENPPDLGSNPSGSIRCLPSSLAKLFRFMLGSTDATPLAEHLQAWENEGGPAHSRDEPYTHTIGGLVSNGTT